MLTCSQVSHHSLREPLRSLNPDKSISLSVIIVCTVSHYFAEAAWDPLAAQNSLAVRRS